MARRTLARWFVVVVVIGITSILFTTTAIADPNARITIGEARKVALARVPGTIVHEKLKQKKHKHPIYSLKIKPTGAAKTTPLKKVEIDGDTGKVLKVKDVKAKAKKPKGDDDED